MIRLLVIVLMSALLAGCATDSQSIYSEKDTVFGVDISYDSSSTSPRIRIGLIRHFRNRVPTATNHIYAPTYATSMNAEITPLKQTVREDFGTGDGVSVVTNSGTAAKITFP